MVQRGGSQRFLLKTPQPVGIDRKCGGQNLDSNFAPQTGIARAIDFAHTAGAKQRNDFVGTKFGAGGEVHQWARL